jgi:ferredoxin
MISLPILSQEQSRQFGDGAIGDAVATLTNAFPPRRTDVPQPGDDQVMGFFTDTTLCIGCKACEVACKQWNQLPSDGLHFTGYSYDNTAHLSATTWLVPKPAIDAQRCLQALPKRAVRACLSNRFDHLQSIRRRLRPERHLQRLRLLHCSLPVRRARSGR